MTEIRTGIRLEGDSQSYVQATAQAEAATRKLDEAQKVADAGMKRQALSAGEWKAAMRTLPAQLTDIFTGLASGQAPMTVAIQQGGQLRDQFGSFSNVLQGVRSVISPTTLAIGGMGAVVGLAALAYQKGQAEIQEYRRQILLTGNAAGVTVGQLDALARRAANTSGGTQGDAAGVLAQLVGTAQVSRAQLGAAAEAAIRLERDLGLEVQKTVQAFAQLGKEPLQAAVKLNEQYNFLTLQTYKRIKALDDAKRTDEAAAIAQDAFAKAAIERSKEQLASLGSLERGWQAVKSSAASAWDAMLGAGREKTVEQQLSEVQDQINAAERQAREGAAAFQAQFGPGVRLPGLADAAAQGVSPEVARLRQQQAELQELQRLQQRQAGRQASDAAAVREQAERDKNAPKFEPLSAIRDPRQQYKADFLRSEKGTYDQLAEMDRKAKAEALKREEELQRELEEQYARRERLEAQRAERARQAIEELTLDNRRANAEMITDDEQRGRALIALDEEEMRRRVNLTASSVEERKQFEEQLAQWRINREKQLTEQLKSQWQRTLEAWGDNARLFKDTWDAAVTSTISSGEEAWKRWVRTGKLSLRELENALIDLAASYAYRQVIGAGFRFFTGGGVGGSPGDSLGPNVLPASDRATAARASAGGSGGVTLVNTSSTPLKVSSVQQRADGGLEVILAQVEDYLAGRVASGQGSLAKAGEGRYGWQPTFSS